MITLIEIKQAITEGKVPRIYYSSGTLWWTHDPEDVKVASELGRAVQRNLYERMINDPEVPEHTKERFRDIIKGFGGKHNIPLDPTGAPLYQLDEQMVSTWISAAEKKPDHFGKHGLDAFMRVHHQNCNGEYFISWDAVNIYIDTEQFKLDRRPVKDI